MVADVFGSLISREFIYVYEIIIFHVSFMPDTFGLLTKLYSSHILHILRKSRFVFVIVSVLLVIFIYTYIFQL